MAPLINAGVMMANMSWNEANASSGEVPEAEISVSFSPTRPKPPMKPWFPASLANARE